MTRRVRVPIAGLQPGRTTLEAAAARHLVRVLRLREGEAFVAFDPKRAVEADGRVVRAERGIVQVELSQPQPARNAPRLPCLWIQGLAKGEKTDAIVRDATELGATRVAFASTERSVVRLGDGAVRSKQIRWEKIAVEAARQCGRADPPQMDPPCPWREALASASSYPARFCLYELADEPLGPPLRAALAKGASLAFAAGPEGGLEESEVAEAAALGFVPVSLGELILRAETVVSAVLGAVRIFVSC
jgi:16S rRNA (uracil1498-N3)-methyltransferase